MTTAEFYVDVDVVKRASYHLEVEITRLTQELERVTDEYDELAELLFGESERSHEDVYKRLVEVLNHYTMVVEPGCRVYEDNGDSR